MAEIYYNMIDRPAIKFPKERMSQAHYINKPRKEFNSLELALKEAKRLAHRTKARVLTLQVVNVTIEENVSN